MNDRHGCHEGPKPEKHCMAKRQKTGITEKKIVADGKERENDDLRQHVQMVLFKDEGHKRSCQE